MVGQDALEAGLVEHDPVIQIVAADRADQPFDVKVPPGRPRRGKHILVTRPIQAFAEGVAVSAVARSRIR